MSRVRIAQCLCGPARHALIALLFDVPEDEASDLELAQTIQGMIGAMLAGKGAQFQASMPNMPAKMDGWCGLCGAKAPDWIYEVRWSRDYPTVEEAIAVAKEMEARQQFTSALAHRLGVSYNARRKAGMN